MDDLEIVNDDCPGILQIDGYIMAIDKENFIAYHPLKSKLDIAKEKQLSDFYNAIVDANESVAIESLKWMQDNGMLAEIALPLVVK